MDKYGIELTKDKIKEFDNFIKKLKDKDRYMLCKECHKQQGCINEHDKYLFDTGVCAVCGKVNDVVNCKVANKVIDDNILISSYFKKGQRIVK